MIRLDQKHRDNINQKAELRIALFDKGKHQLLVYVDLINFDLYAGPHGVHNKLRSTWHETGKVHIHTPIGRQIGPPRVLPEHFKGKSKLYSGGYIGNDWSYHPKPDSLTRRTLIISKSLVERGISFDLWAVEQSREDLVAQILEEYNVSGGLEIVSFITIDWTQPQLVGVVRTLTIASWESLMLSQNQKRN